MRNFTTPLFMLLFVTLSYVLSGQTDFSYACTDGVVVETYGKSEDKGKASLYINNTTGVFKTVIEIVYKGCDPGNSVTATINGTTTSIPEILVSGGSSNVHVYRKTFNYAVSSAVTNESCNSLQSILAFVFRNVSSNITSSGVYTSVSGYCDVQNFTVPLLADASPRDVTISVPVSEVTNDGRHMKITATAGGQSAFEYINNPSIGCCLSIVEVVVPNVPGSATSVAVNVNTQSSTDNFNPKNCGQSYVISGVVKADAECNTVACAGNITALKIYDQATDAPAAGIPALSNGQSINLSDLPENYYITAETNGNIESVNITLNGLPQNCENNIPYTFPNGADSETDGGWNGGVGTYVVNAKAYAQDDCQGEICSETNISFSISQDCQDFSVDAGDDVNICEEESVTLSAMVEGSTECDCCIRTVSNTDHCNNTEFYVLWLDGTHYKGNDDLTWEECGDGTARLTGTATKGSTTYNIDITYSGYSSTPPQGSPKNNGCGSTNANGWFYYTEIEGTLKKGSTTYTLERSGPAFQVGNGANITTLGYGGSGWFKARSGSTVLNGDINIMLSQNCSSSASCGSQTIAGMSYLGAYGNSHYYMKMDGDLQYQDAKNFVNSRGGHLPKIETPGENEWIASKISGSIWLSLNDAVQEGTWRWHDNELAIYTNWKSGEPSNNSGEDYARMLPDGKWTDREETHYYWVVMEVECGNQGSGGINEDVSYLWTPGNFTTPSITVSPSSTTTYTVQVTGCDGCVASDNVTVFVDGDFDCPADLTINCDESSHPDVTGYPTLTCDPNATITYTDSDSGTCPTVKTRTWKASVIRIIEDACVPEDLAHWNFSNANNKCSQGIQPLDNGGLSASSVANSNCNALVVSKVYNDDGSSCVKGVSGSAESAICVSATSESSFKNNDDDAITFTIQFGAQDEGSISSISFYEKVQKNNENFGKVDYARKFGVRVLKNGIEIYKNDNNPTTLNTWTQHTFDFTSDNDFKYSGATTFKFEILGYDPTSFGYNMKVWEFDELRVRGCCGMEVSNEVQEFTCTQKITINDNEFPELMNVPNDITVFCTEDVPAVSTNVVASDNCSFSTDFEENITNQTACNKYTITRTWTVTDECNNQTSDSQVITVDDFTPPTASNPAEIVIECYSDVPNPNPDVVIDEDDNCEGPLVVTWIDDDPGSVPCDGFETIIKRRYRVTDCSGNTKDVYQDIRINNDGPTIVCPSDQTIECAADIVPGTPTVNADCTPNPVVTTSGPLLVSGQGDCTGAKYELTYTVEDDCGRTASCIQTFTIENDGPSITCPADKTIECVDGIEEGIPSVLTSCELEYEVIIALPTIIGSQANCPGNHYVIIYAAIDECGRSSECEQRFTIDNDGPSITCPADEFVECYEDIVEGIPSVSVSCFLNYDVTTTGPTLISGLDDCDGSKYTIVYTATDECGRSASCTQTFTIDNDGPSITCPADQTVECYDDIAEGIPVVTVSCNLDYDITTDGPSLISGQDGCDGAKYAITYTATDDCGRSASCTQTFTLDNEGPSITCPADLTIECIDEMVEGTPTVTVACGLDYEIIVAMPDVFGPTINCPDNVYTISYVVIDECGRDASCEQKFTIANEPPTISCPADVTLECYEDIVEGTPVVTTSCNLEYDITTDGPNLVSGQDGCDDSKYEITYTVTDVCGRSASCTQTFTLDNEGPSIVCPADQTIECYDDIQEGTPTVTPACGLTYDVVTDGPNLVFGQDDCNGAKYEIIYTATDECGRMISCTQTFTIDNEGPSIVCPADQTVECYADVLVGTAVVTTSCDLGFGMVTAGPHLVFGQDGCYGAKYEITYTATDDCGREASCTQTFTLENEGPSIVCPADKTVECYLDIQEGTPVVTTSCGLTYDVFTDGPNLIFGQDECDGAKYEIIYTATDECGREVSCTQTFTLENEGPSIVCPSDKVVECYADISVGTAVVTTSCGLGFGLVTDGPHLVFGQDGCDGAKYEISYTATDECGREASCTQTFTLDNDGPSIVCPADKTVECYADISAGIAVVTTSCELDYGVVTDGPHLVFGQDGCDGAIYEITYTATDECGREANCTQKFTLDNNGPNIVCPADKTVECYADISAGTAVVTTSCELEYGVVTDGPHLVFGQDGCDGAKYEITYTATDECGREASCTQTFTLENDGPRIVCPSDKIVECYADISVGTAVVTTSCGLDYEVVTDGPHLVFGEDGCDNAKYEITYTATDDCGRSASCTQTFTLNNDGPIITCPPNLTVGCYYDIQEGTPTVTTSCGLTYDVVTDGPHLIFGQDGCDGARYEITYTATDECGRSASCTQKFTLENDGPSIVCPADQTVECYYDIQEGTPTVTTSCGLTYDVVTDGPHLVFGQDECNGARYEITYTATDECGRKASCTQRFTLDNEGPSIVCPADKTVECYADISVGTAVVTTSCNLGFGLVTSGPHLVFGQDGCDGARYEITYTATDDCGREASCTQTFTLDNNGPSIVCPADKTVECYADISVGTAVVTTSCGLTYGVVTDGPHLIFGQDGCDGARYEITYTATDECGRSASCTQKFTLDNEGPSIVCPADKTVECYADISVGTAVVTTSCGLGFGLVTNGPHLVFGQDGCDGAKYEITYTATDECGREASCTQTFTLDNEGPRIVCPADKIVECYADISVGIAVVTTSCNLEYDVVTDGPHLVFGEEGCDGAKYEITYTATDECGREASCTQTFTLDNEGPTITCPPNLTVECYYDIQAGTPTVTTSCGLTYGLVTDGPHLVFGQDGCDGARYEITYTATDECGRSASCTQRFTLDNEGPSIVCPADKTVECYYDIQEGTPTVTTSCGLIYDVVTDGPHLVFGQDECDGARYEITYTATDECGRKASCTQTFTLDNNGPTIVCPADKTVECYADISVGTAVVTTSCNLGFGLVTSGPHLIFGQDGCDGAIYEITYTATDDCGRNASCTQKFTLDNNGPTIVCPADKTVECYADIAAGTAVVTTSCDLEFGVVTDGPHLVFGQDGCDGAIYEITYTATDECGRNASCTQKFTLDNNGPSIVCPADRTVECFADVVAMTPTVTTSCGLTHTVTREGPFLISGQDGCDGARYEFKYTATDECGRQASCKQVFTLDNEGPRIVCPADRTVECYADISVGTAVVTTSCGLTHSVVTSGPSLVFGEEGCDGAKYEIVYTATDECGRSASCTQTFTLDNEGPSITCPPNLTVECYYDIQAGTPTVTTSCGLTYGLVTDGPHLIFGQDGCDGSRYEITYTATDECGRSASCTQRFTLDNEGPTIVCPPNLTVECYYDIQAGTPTVTTSCGLTYGLVTDGPRLVFGQDGCDDARYEITYTATDECGRKASCTQTFTLDNEGPTIVCPSDKVVECYADISVGTAVVTTSCNLGFGLVTNGPRLVFGQDGCDGARYEITYTATDECGRSASCTQTFTLDNNGPSIVCPADRTVECYADISVGTAVVTTSCGLGFGVVTDGPHLVFGQDGCDGAIYEITYTATDECGRNASCTQKFTLDNHGPTIVCPADRTVECFANVIAMTPTVTTSCGLTHTVTREGPFLISGQDGCDGARYEFKYTATDECGREASCKQIFTLDNDGPRIVCPADRIVECYADITVGTAVVTTSCGLTHSLVTTGPNLVFGEDGCNGARYEIVYTATDECGRSASCTQTFTLNNEGPTIVCPPNLTVECYYEIQAGTPTVTTSCGLTFGVVTDGPHLVFGQDGCDGARYEITYTATDECGRSASCTQRFTLDNEGPTIVCPPNLTVECYFDIQAGTPTVTTSCGLTYGLVTDGPRLVFGQDGCDGARYEITYTATDECGRKANCTQTFTLDNGGPTIVCPADKTVECYADISVGTAVVTTSCDLGFGLVTDGPRLVFGQDGCVGARYEIKYTATDECGRSASCTQTFTLDNDGPTIVCPPNLTVKCFFEIQAGTPTVTTSCGLTYGVVTDGPHLVFGQAGCDGARYEITYTATDECGRSANCTQTFTIDNDGPTIVCPADQTVECYAQIVGMIPQVFTDCGLTHTVKRDGPFLVFGQDGCDGSKYEFVYTATDECGRSASCTQTFTLDNDGPRIVCPADRTVECYADISVGIAVVTTSCGLTHSLVTDGPHLVFGEDGCDGARYEITYTATDECGRSASCTQTFTLDNEGPTIVCPPNLTVQCYFDIQAGTPTVTTSCGLTYGVVTNGPHLVFGQDGCDGARYEITYTTTDECGRNASCTQTFTLDNEGPSIVCPGNLTVECYSDIQAGTPTVTTSCGLTYGLVTDGPHLVFGQDGCDGARYQITYTATDECGRSASCTQTFTLDNEGPSIVCPPNLTVQCYFEIQIGTPTVTTSCGLTYGLVTDGPHLVFGQDGCDGARYQITYTATDECGRSASCTQTFTLDNEGPTIVCPADRTVECFSHVQVGTPTVTTSCGLTYGLVTDGPHLVFGQAGCDGARYQITYTATDECGRSASCTQTFTIDNEGPSIVCPPDAIVECYEYIQPGTPTVFTSCGLTYSLSNTPPVLKEGSHDCDGAIYEVVYTATDECGRTASCTQTFTIDNEGPSIVCPPDRTVECFANILPGIPNVTTSCGLEYDFETSTPTLVFGRHDCDGARYEIVYTVTDACGRIKKCTQRFTIDNNGPSIVCPPDQLVRCSAEIQVGTPVVTTSCGLTYNVTHIGPILVSGAANCYGSVYQIVYTARDECGREASCTQRFTIDNEGPRIVCPPNSIVECVSDINIGIANVITSCQVGYNVTTVGPRLISGQDNCDGSRYEVIYTATDECGRSASCTQIFTLRNFGPTIICPPDQTIECVSDMSQGIPTVITACGVTYDVFVAAPTIIGDDADCPGKQYQILYTVVDACGRTASCTQTFTIDNEGPSIVCPADRTVSCLADIAPGTPVVSTSCNLNYTVTNTVPRLIFGQADCNGAKYEIVYTATDVCGRSASCTQVFTINNNGPVILCPSDKIVECEANITIGIPNISVSCGLEYDYTTSGPTLVFGKANCNGAKYEIVYTATDECGRSASCTQTFTISNNGPTIVCPADRVVMCVAEIGPGTPVVTTSCGVNYNVTNTNATLVSGIANCHGSVYQIVYTVTDFCGRTASCTQRFTINNGGPTIVCPPDATVTCVANITPGTPVVTTSCGLTYNVTTTGPTLVVGSANCPGAKYELKYTVTDACGRQASCVQVFTIQNNGPTIVCPPDALVECVANIIPGTPSVTTSCGLTYNVTTTGPTLVFGQGNCHGAKYELVYTVTDACGRMANCTQVFTINNNGPTIVCPLDKTVECYDDIVIGTPTVTTSCGVGHNITTTGPTLVSGQADCHGAKYEVVYTVRDVCGRSASCTQVFTISNGGPTITCPSDKEVSCFAEITIGVATVNTSCGLDYTISTSGPTLVFGQANCNGARYEVVYTATDACGRTASCTQRFTITNNPPVVTCPPNSVVECHEDIVPGIPNVVTACGMTYTTVVTGPTLMSGQHDCNGAIYSLVYNITDECGRTSSCTQIWSIDNDGPTIVCPLDVTVGRIEDFVPGTPSYNTSCGVNGVITGTGPVLVSGSDCANGLYEYTYTVTDACGRSKSCKQRIFINPSTLACNASGTNTTCGMPNGSANVNAFGGYPPYTYSWNNGSTSTSISGLAAGTYTVTVTDSKGCTSSCSVDIAGSTNPVCSVNGNDASCGDANGSATVTAILGVPPYTYSWSNGATSASVSGLASGTYSVTVTDSRGCTTSCNVNIGDTVPPTCFASGTNTQCNQNNGTATVFGIGGSGIYSYSWNTGAITQTISNLSPGTYTVVVTDSNGCSTDCSVTINDSMAPRCSITATDTDCGLSNGSATVSSVGGTPPYTFEWSNGQTGTMITGLSAGTYSVVITDSAGCQSMCSVTVKASSAPVCNIIGTNTSCGLNNGSAVANVSGGSGNYTYVWSNGAVTNSISNLSPGTYSVTVTDGSGCTTECSVFIQGSAPISCSIAGTNTTCGANNGSATVNVSGGSGSYNYSWNTGSAAQTINGLAAGTYTVNVTDRITGCTTSCMVTIQTSNPISCSIAGTNTSCGLNNGAATVSVFGGSGSYSYSWNTGSTAASINGLASGSYSVNVLDNITGCTTSCTVTIQGSNPISCSVSGTPTGCGLSNGTASVSVIGGSGSFSYTWSNGASGASISGLAQGNYTVNVTDNITGCTTSCSVTIQGSNPISCSINPSPTTCGLSNGTAVVSVNGGSGSFSYSWSNGANTQAISGLSAGNYSVTVVDTQSGCSTSCSVSIAGSNPIACTISSSNPSCGSSNGTATVSVSGGSGNYNYSWNNGANTQSISGLSAGTYTVNVLDNVTGCATTCNVTLQPSSNISCTIASTNPACGLSNGSATVNVTGGSGSFSYAWSNGSNSQTVNGLAAGNYSVTVTDIITGCTTSCNTVLQGSNPISCSVASTNPSCGLSNGSATVTVFGGSGNYNYSWNNGGTSATISGLAAGTYIVNVVDISSGCSTSCSVVISSSVAITCNINSSNASCGLNNGTASVSVIGGSGNFNYSWSNGASGQSISGLAPGTYSVTVVDVNSGCTTNCSTVIGGSNPISCTATSTGTGCGMSNGTASVSVNGGSGSFTYAWNNGGGNTATITGLAQGNYSVIVTDNVTGCVTSCSTTVSGSNSISCSVAGVNTSCGLNNGSATVSVSGGSGSFSYSWSNGSGLQSITNLPAGTYFVDVVDTQTGCSTSCSVVIQGSTSPVCSISGTNANCGTNNGSAVVTVNGGQAPYTYSWSNGANTSTINGLSAGSYQVTVVDNNGCSTQCSVNIGSSSAVTCVAGSTDETCNDANGTAWVTASGGTGVYTYLWSNGATSSSLTGLSVGFYSVTVTDSNGCSSVCNTTVSGMGVPVCSTISTPDACGQSNGTATVAASGGAGNYTYLWSNGATTPTIFGLMAGTYTVTVTDMMGCTAVRSIVVDGTDAPNCIITSQNASCGASTGSATVVASGGAGNYTYLWSNGATTATISNVPSGTYAVTVTDQGGCTSVCTTVISLVSSPRCTITSTDAGCGQFNGTARVTVTGGIPQYTYLWSNGATTSNISGLAPGNYSVTVTDSKGCTTSCSVFVGSEGNMSCNVQTSDTSCGNNNGTASVSVSGGSGVYTYLWSNGGTTASISGLAQGTYTVTVTDNQGCMSICTGTVVMSSNGPSCTISGSDSSCGESNGTATATIFGGVGPYTYLWSNGSTSSSISNLIAGDYSLTVTDVNGCTSVCGITIESVGGPTCSITVFDASCGSSNGALAASAFGGAGLYSFQWSNGGTSPNISGLSAGFYSVTITDQKGCQVVCTAEVGNDGSNCTAEIGDFVWEDLNANGIQDAGEPGIRDVQVVLWNANAGNIVSVQTTDSLGRYCFTGLAEGHYYCEFGNLPPTYINYVASPNVMPISADTINSDITGANGNRTTNTFFLSQGDKNKNIDAGFYRGATLGNQVWCDNPEGGLPNLFDSGDSPVEGAIISLYRYNLMNGSETLVGTQTTDANGNYLFTGLTTGTYFIEADVTLLGKVFVSANAQDFNGNQPDDIDSDIIYRILEEQETTGETRSVGRTNLISLTTGQINLTIDIGLGEGTVPIELYDFVGRWNGDKSMTELEWTTDTEINSYYFSVERTSDLSESFEEIGKVQAVGNSSSTNYYDFDDTSIFESGTYYYRLRMVDLDGTYSYSKVVVVEVEFDEREQEIILNVYPNPVIDEVTVEINVERPSLAEGGIYDAIGQRIKDLNIDRLEVGRTTLRVDVNDLPSGTYLLRMKINDNVIFEKITKTE